MPKKSQRHFDNMPVRTAAYLICIALFNNK